MGTHVSATAESLVFTHQCVTANWMVSPRLSATAKSLVRTHLSATAECPPEQTAPLSLGHKPATADELVLTQLSATAETPGRRGPVPILGVHPVVRNAEYYRMNRAVRRLCKARLAQ